MPKRNKRSQYGKKGSMTGKKGGRPSKAQKAESAATAAAARQAETERARAAWEVAQQNRLQTKEGKQRGGRASAEKRKEVGGSGQEAANH